MSKPYKFDKLDKFHLNPRSGTAYALSKTVEYLKQGIGLSKHLYKEAYGKSPYIHSYETLERYVGVFNHFKDTVLISDRVNTINKITTIHIDTHFDNLLKQNCSEKTISINASALMKLFEVLDRYDLMKYIESKRLLWRKSATPSVKTEPFVCPEKVIQAMPYPYKAYAIIQYLTGARVSDIRKVYEWILKNPQASVITIKKSKGGRDRTIDYSDRPVSLGYIRDAVEKIRRHFKSDDIDWARYMKEYTKEVRVAARKCNETYCGTHAFRVNYANERYDGLFRENDMLNEREKKILSIITEDLGHSRLSMAKYYISAYRK